MFRGDEQPLITWIWASIVPTVLSSSERERGGKRDVCGNDEAAEMMGSENSERNKSVVVDPFRSVI